jgi:dihydropteroate synthase
MPKLMGILNATPDSFYDGDPSFSIEKLIDKGKRLFDEGADILDIGGESTKPGANSVSTEEEIIRILPLIKALSKLGPISVDTRNPEVAEIACAEGAFMINDVEGLRNSKMAEVVIKYQVDVCIMHMLRVPATMQQAPVYEKGVVQDIFNTFETQTQTLNNRGFSKDKIWLDPGIGFGKTVADNWEILHNLPVFKKLGYPLLVGLSRKSFMSKILNKKPQDLLAATLAMNAKIYEHVDIFRVHDVKEHRDLIDLFSYRSS